MISISITSVYLHRLWATYGLSSPSSCRLPALTSFLLQTVKRKKWSKEPNIVRERTGHMRQSSAIVQWIKIVYHSGPVILGLQPNAIYDLERGTYMHNVC